MNRWSVRGRVGRSRRPLGRTIMAVTVAVAAALMLLVPSVAFGDDGVPQDTNDVATNNTAANDPAATTPTTTTTHAPPTTTTPTTTTTTTTTTTPPDSTTKDQPEPKTDTPTDTEAATQTDGSTMVPPGPTSTAPAAASLAATDPPPSSECAARGTESVMTDKADYAPEETVHVSGSGYGSSCLARVEMTRPDGKS